MGWGEGDGTCSGNELRLWGQRAKEGGLREPVCLWQGHCSWALDCPPHRISWSPRVISQQYIPGLLTSNSTVCWSDSSPALCPCLARYSTPSPVCLPACTLAPQHGALSEGSDALIQACAHTPSPHTFTHSITHPADLYKHTSLLDWLTDP